MKHQLETFIAHDQFSGRAANFTVLASVSLCDVGNVSPFERPITTQLAADSRGASAKQSSYLALTKILILPDLDRGAFFDAEFCIGHGGTLPEGEVLHSVFAAALRFLLKQDQFAGHLAAKPLAKLRVRP
jgi:hypothetical protein